MLKQWSKRKVTLFGRITIIKSLALSKFVSLFVFHCFYFMKIKSAFFQETVSNIFSKSIERIKPGLFCCFVSNKTS